tara:strand:- start:333 stop:536 length:204 start_codon:yes stop_codon:yes gene_type:complete
MVLDDIIENKQLDNIIESQVDYLYNDLLTKLNRHNRRHHKYTVKKQKEITKNLIRVVITQGKILDII